MIATYGDAPHPISSLGMRNIVNQEFKLYGFIVTSLSAKHELAFYRDVPKLVAQGKIKYTEEVTVGLQYAGHALAAMLDGTHKGKSVVLVSSPDASASSV